MYVITCTRILLKSSYKVPRDASFSISSSLYVPTYMTSCEYGIDFTPCYQPPPKRREHFQWRNKRSTTRGWLFGLWVNTKNKVSFCVEEVEERVKAVSVINLLKNGSCSSFFSTSGSHSWFVWFLRFFERKGGFGYGDSELSLVKILQFSDVILQPNSKRSWWNGIGNRTNHSGIKFHCSKKKASFEFSLSLCCV